MILRSWYVQLGSTRPLQWNDVHLAFSYRENARILSRAYRDRPVPPMETAVWWTEYIARGNGKPYLRSKGADLPWYQYHLVDVALVLIIIFAVFIYILFRLIKLLLSLLCAVKGKLGSRTMKRKKDWCGRWNAASRKCVEKRAFLRDEWWVKDTVFHSKISRFVLRESISNGKMSGGAFNC